MGVGNVLAKLGQFGLGGLMGGEGPLSSIAMSPVGGLGLLQRLQGGQHQQVQPDREVYSPTPHFMPQIPDQSMSFADTQLPAGAIEALAAMRAGRGGPAQGQSALARMPGLMRSPYRQRY